MRDEYLDHEEMRTEYLENADFKLFILEINDAIAKALDGHVGEQRASDEPKVFVDRKLKEEDSG